MGVAAVITSGKGGVGKSTVTVGLGRALSEKGKRVLLIDCDAGLRSLDRMTGAEEELVYDVSDVVFGRCAPAEAIYKCSRSEGLYMMPAPASEKDCVRPRVMKQLVALLKRYYDYVLLDSPAGVGTGFESASCAADKAVIVCSPDPVCVRSASVTDGLLEKLGVEERRLVINRFNMSFFTVTDAYEDLDAVIDSSGVQLLGVVPEDHAFAASFLRGEAASAKNGGMAAIHRLAARLEGEDIPIPFEKLI